MSWGLGSHSSSSKSRFELVSVKIFLIFGGKLKGFCLWKQAFLADNSTRQGIN